MPCQSHSLLLSFHHFFISEHSPWWIKSFFKPVKPVSSSANSSDLKNYVSNFLQTFNKRSFLVINSVFSDCSISYCLLAFSFWDSFFLSSSTFCTSSSNRSIMAALISICWGNELLVNMWSLIMRFNTMNKELIFSAVISSLWLKPLSSSAWSWLRVKTNFTTLYNSLGIFKLMIWLPKKKWSKPDKVWQKPSNKSWYNGKTSLSKSEYCN